MTGTDKREVQSLPATGGVVARLERYIETRRLDARILRLPAPMPTVAAAAEQMQVPPAAIAKTLVFTDDDGTLVVAVAPGDRRVLPDLLAASVGTDVLRMAPRDAVLRMGYSPGAVAPVSFLHAVKVVVDDSLVARERVLAGGGEHDLLLDIAVSDIVACNRAVIAAITRGTSA